MKKFLRKKKKHIFMDYASGTPIKKNVFKAMLPYFSLNFYNPNAIYQEAFEIKKEIKKARKKIGKIISANTNEIIFTEGGTEANNLALKGIVYAWKTKHKNKKAHIITSSIEHASILETCKTLEKNGFAEVSYLKVNAQGEISIKEMKKTIKGNTLLISISYVNGEIGTIQNIREIAKTIRHYKKQNKSSLPYFHSDVIQAVNYLPINVQKLGVDLLSISAAKIYGPKKMALLYRKKNIPMEPLIEGGNQEFGLRAGTENTPYIIGFCKALEETQKKQEFKKKKMEQLQTYGEMLLKEKLSSTFIINGEKAKRIPSIINISIPYLSSEEILLRLDAKGIKASVKSACKSNDVGDSHVISSLRDNNTQSLRFSFGEKTTKRDIKFMVKKLVEIENKMLDTYEKYIK